MEIVVVVIGVLLALSVQQWAEARTSSRRATDAEARIREELLGASANVAERVAVYGCLQRRLIELAAGVANGGPDWRPTTMPEPGAPGLAFGLVYRVPTRGYRSDAFHGAMASGDLNSLPPERLGSISVAYAMLDAIAQKNREEVQLAAGLGSLRLAGPQTSVERGAVLADLARLDAANFLLRLTAVQHFGQMREIGFVRTPAEAERDRRESTARRIADGRSKYGNCFDADMFAALVLRGRPLAAGR